MNHIGSHTRLKRHTSIQRRLLFLSTSVGFGSGHIPGGGEFFAGEFLEELHKRGWEITVVCPRQSPLRQRRELRDHAAWELLDLSANLKTFRFFTATLAWLRLSCRFRDAVIYGNGFNTMKWLVLAKLAWQAKVICHLHESSYAYYDSWRASLEAPLIDRFIAISDSVRNFFLKGSGVSAKKVIRVHNGVPVAKDTPKTEEEKALIRREFRLSVSGPLVMMAARTDPLKGHETFLRMVSRVRETLPEATFLIAGLQATTPDEIKVYQRLQQIILAERIGGSLRTTGFEARIRRLMRGSDLVVVPSIQEGFGRTAIEAMAEQTLVIASDVGGLSEIISNQVNGYTFPSGDHRALALTVCKALQNPSESQKMAYNGYLTVSRQFSTQAMADLIEPELMQVTVAPAKTLAIFALI